MSPGTAKRIRRIRQHGSPELIQAFDLGLLSAGAAENLARLSPAEQMLALGRRQALAGRQQHRCRQAAQIIGRYLDTHPPQHLDLDELRQLLIAL